MSPGTHTECPKNRTKVPEISITRSGHTETRSRFTVTDEWSPVVGLVVTTAGSSAAGVELPEKKKKIHDSWGKCLRTGFRTPVEGKRGRWGG